MARGRQSGTGHVRLSRLAQRRIDDHYAFQLQTGVISSRNAARYAGLILQQLVTVAVRSYDRRPSEKFDDISEGTGGLPEALHYALVGEGRSGFHAFYLRRGQQEIEVLACIPVSMDVAERLAEDLGTL